MFLWKYKHIHEFGLDVYNWIHESWASRNGSGWNIHSGGKIYVYVWWIIQAPAPDARSGKGKENNKRKIEKDKCKRQR